MNLEEEIRRAEQAAMIINHPLYAEAFNTLEERLLEAWKTSPARDAEGRESLWLSVKILNQTRAHLSSLIETGKMADVELSRRGVK